MIESVRPISGTEYAAVLKSLWGTAVKGQDDDAYSVDISFNRVTGKDKATDEQLVLIGKQREPTDTSLRNLVGMQLSKQEKAYQIAFGKTGDDSDISVEEQKEAKEAVTGNGYWSAERVSDRVMALAVTMANNDPLKFSELKAVIQSEITRVGLSINEGEADISNQTYRTIMRKLELQAAELKSKEKQERTEKEQFEKKNEKV